MDANRVNARTLQRQLEICQRDLALLEEIYEELTGRAFRVVQLYEQYLLDKIEAKELAIAMLCMLNSLPDRDDQSGPSDAPR
jgi:hypothetical protein